MTTPATAPAARAATAPGYITLLVGRGMYGKMTGGRLDPQILTIDQVAPTLQPTGLWAAGNVIARTAETAGRSSAATPTPRGPTGSGPPAPRLGHRRRHLRPRAGTTPPRRRSSTPASPTPASTEDPSNTGPTIPAPYSIRAESPDGGNLAGQPCSSIFKRNHDRPAIVTARLSPGANQWGLVQFYHLVTGSRPRNGTAPAWDCRNPDWRYHWSTLAESYCADDCFNAVWAAKTSWGANVGAATPAQVARAWGRGTPTLLERGVPASRWPPAR